MENNKLIRKLNNDIKVLPDKDINDTLIYALKLLHSLTRNINKSMYIILKNEVSCTKYGKLNNKYGLCLNLHIFFNSMILKNYYFILFLVCKTW